MQLDQKILFSALSFFAVIIKDVPKDRLVQRANALAKLMEEFCEVSEVRISAIGNGLNNHQELLQESMEALQLCLEEGELTFSSEQMADRVISRIQASVS